MAGSPVGWDHPRSADASRHLLETGEAHGIDASKCLAGTGLIAAQLTDPTTEVQAQQELTIVRNLLSHVDDPTGLGIETGLRYNLASTGILGYAFLTSPTVRDAVTIGLRFAALSSIFLEVSVYETGEELVMEFDAGQIPSDVSRFLLDRDLAAMARVAPLLIGMAESAAQIRIELQDAGYLVEVLDATGLSFIVEDGAPRTAIAVPRELLDQPMAAADPDTAAVCIAQCEELLDRRRHRRGFAAQLRARLIKDPAQIPSMTAMAREFAVTERTLHRRLSAENTTYRVLVDEIREALAVELLGNDLTVEEVARRLGYSETAAFTHAFIRWRGHPPSHLNRR